MGSVGVGVGEVEGLVVDLEISADIREAKSMVDGICRGCRDPRDLWSSLWWTVCVKFVRSSGFEIVARLNILAPRDLPPASYGAYPRI